MGKKLFVRYHLYCFFLTYQLFNEMACGYTCREQITASLGFIAPP